MAVLKWISRKLKSISPAVVREIIVVLVLLCISIILSIPDYTKDKELAAIQKEMINSGKEMEEAADEGRGTVD